MYHCEYSYDFRFLTYDFGFSDHHFIFSLKIRQDQGTFSDSQWKKKYYDLDKQHRNLKEDFDVLVARNKNGR